VAKKVAEGSPSYAARVCYVESSALVAALLEHDSDALRVLDSGFTFVSSELTFAESRRALKRAVASGRLAAREVPELERALTTFANHCEVVLISAAVIDRVGRPFPAEPVRTLDAIHLATLSALDGPAASVSVLTRDRRIQSNATAMGFEVI
jgi:predicted nucleic acid-binding protein